MNKTEKLISLVLGALLVWVLVSQMSASSRRAAANKPPVQSIATVTSQVPAPTEAKAMAQSSVVSSAAKVQMPSVPEEIVVLENEELRLVLSSWGAVVRKATLLQYGREKGAISAENPPVDFDYGSSPLGELRGLAEVAPNAAYTIKEKTKTSVTFVCGTLERRYELSADYRVILTERFGEKASSSAVEMSVGQMRMGDSKNDQLSMDGCVLNEKGEEIVHYCDDDEFKSYLVGGVSGGCGCGSGSSKSQAPLVKDLTVSKVHKWLALKNRFFVTALAKSDGIQAVQTSITRKQNSASYRPESLSALVRYASLPSERTSEFYIGPKKQALLSALGMREVMEFGMWRFVCYPIVWLLNLFYAVIPNYGIAIILLTILVRLIFWPLTHKSTVGMKKMQEVQPLMKELQAKFKDNPQRLRMEMMELYRKHHVNPMSSCLPMLIQIPVFIALFNVLRAAVELRYAPFLWISDLSEPEGLFASWFPFGGLNILPILMAATMALQSALTPSVGDKQQQKMMIVFMPVMMLVMFYSFPSALSLYWTLSQVFSIVQMWLIRRQTATKALVPEVIDPPVTRQMRRHG